MKSRSCDIKGCADDAVTNLDGEWLCQKHADAWVRAEGEWQEIERELAEEYPENTISGRQTGLR